MRPIEFIAWDRQEKKMIIVGTLVFFENGLIGVNGTVSRDIFDLIQYTGFKDINDEKIYEGWIVDAGGLIYKVEWSEGYWLVGIETNQKVVELNSFMINKLSVKIIGNIFENLKLNRRKK
jgi:hypothetical protein